MSTLYSWTLIAVMVGLQMLTWHVPVEQKPAEVSIYHDVRPLQAAPWVEWSAPTGVNYPVMPPRLAAENVAPRDYRDGKRRIWKCTPIVGGYLWEES